MNMNNEKTEIEITVKHDEIATFTVAVIWHPTPLLRCRRDYLSIDMVKYDLVLQQMWCSNTGIEEWRDIQEVDEK